MTLQKYILCFLLCDCVIGQLTTGQLTSAWANNERNREIESRERDQDETPDDFYNLSWKQHMITLACSIGKADQLWCMLSYGNQEVGIKRNELEVLYYTESDGHHWLWPGKQDSIFIHLKYTWKLGLKTLPMERKESWAYSRPHTSIPNTPAHTHTHTHTVYHQAKVFQILFNSVIISFAFQLHLPLT